MDRSTKRSDVYGDSKMMNDKEEAQRNIRKDRIRPMHETICLNCRKKFNRFSGQKRYCKNCQRKNGNEY